MHAKFRNNKVKHLTVSRLNRLGPNWHTVRA